MVAENRKKSVDVLNRAVAEELTAVHQYMYFHFHCEDMGLKPLADLFHKISIDEMRHVETLAERIIYLKGDVTMSFAKPVEYINGDVAKMLAYADELEKNTIANYNEFIGICAAEGDHNTKRIFESILAQEEDHEDIFDTEGDNLHKYGDMLLALNAIEFTKGNGQ
ncbi:bacterioferritin [Alistipes sp. OttesenSCG-928-B03]|nr:bacterioferritin [Alistipes sp. OttesenSCG-928-B03]